MASEKDKVEKSKQMIHSKHLPKDAQVIMSILKELNVEEYDQRVINQLLEFTYRYVTCTLEEAKVVANHARKKVLDIEDVKLSLNFVQDKAFTGPLQRHVVAKLTEVRNAIPLPPIKPHCGLRLPPDRYCLTAVNYKFRSTAQLKKAPKSVTDSRPTTKVQTKSTAIPVGTSLKRAASTVPKVQTINIPKPVIKFTTTVKSPTTEEKDDDDDINDQMDTDIVIVDAESSSMNIDSGTSINNAKRPRENDESF